LESSVLTAIEHPITALVTSAQLLEEDFDTLSPQQMRERIASMHRGAFWLHELVENVLSAATIRAGRLYLRRQTMRVEEVVEETSSVVGPILSQQGQRLETSLEASTLEVDADPRRIGQVLVNLISNASDHSTPGSPTEIAVESRGPSVRVSVADRGAALRNGSHSDGDRSAARPDFDLQSATETANLGLAVAKWIIEAHGGRVGASNRRGGGARFWFELPGVNGAA
jgi:K+-sensing histidine kinase KdpD